MKVIHKIKIHLDDNRMLQPVEVMQGDANTRLLEFSLYAEGKEWTVPADVSVSVAYFGASGRGAYDTLPDGSAAYTVNGNVVQATLIQQVTAVFGTTTVTVVFTDGTGKQLAAFGVPVKVERNAAVGAGKPQNYYNLREWVSAGPLHISIEAKDGGWFADRDYDEIRQEQEASREIVCHLAQNGGEDLELRLIQATPAALIFGAVVDGVEWQAVISRAETGASAVEVTSTACGKEPLYVTLSASTSSPSGYAADKSFAKIQVARSQGRAVDCRVSTMILPLVGLSSTTAVFAAENKEKGYRVMIRNDGSATYDVTTYLLEPAATDEIYFDITADGVLSLKPEYRGEVPAAAAGNAKYVDAVSDRGADLAGTQNHELPEEIVIPKVVEGIAVTAYAYGMLMGNKRIKQLTLPPTVKAIPGHFCYGTWNLRKVNGTEAITTLGTNAFQNSGILEANFPALLILENKGHFQCCADLVVADLGTAITAIPEGCFFGCEKLTRLSGPSNVKTVGKNGFMNTRRLASVPFPLSGLTSIGDYGFLISRIDYDWDSLTNCTFGTLSTAKDLYSEDYWSDCSFTPRLVPLRSTYSQLDPRWTDKKIGNTNCIYSCAPIAMAMAYSALMGVELSSPEEFMEIVYAANPALKDVDPSSEDCSAGNAIVQYMTAAGFEAACYPASDDGCLQAAYDALAEGAVLLQHCIPGSGNSGHVVLVYGINANGELLCADPTSMTAKLGRYEAGLYSMAAKNRMRVPPVDGHYTNGFWIVKKKEA